MVHAVIVPSEKDPGATDRKKKKKGKENQPPGQSNQLVNQLIAEDLAKRSGIPTPEQDRQRQKMIEVGEACHQQRLKEIHERHLFWLKEEDRKIRESAAHRRHQEEVHRIEEEISQQFLLHDAVQQGSSQLVLVSALIQKMTPP